MRKKTERPAYFSLLCVKAHCNGENMVTRIFCIAVRRLWYEQLKAEDTAVINEIELNSSGVS